MAGHRKFSELRSRMTPKRRARNQAATAAMLAEMPLSELRQKRQLTQEALAAVLEADQGNISKLERRTVMYISILRRYIEALGGNLRDHGPRSRRRRANHTVPGCGLRRGLSDQDHRDRVGVIGR